MVRFWLSIRNETVDGILDVGGFELFAPYDSCKIGFVPAVYLSGTIEMLGDFVVATNDLLKAPDGDSYFEETQDELYYLVGKGHFPESQDRKSYFCIVRKIDDSSLKVELVQCHERVNHKLKRRLTQSRGGDSLQPVFRHGCELICVKHAQLIRGCASRGRSRPYPGLFTVVGSNSNPNPNRRAKRPRGSEAALTSAVINLDSRLLPMMNDLTKASSSGHGKLFNQRSVSSGRQKYLKNAKNLSFGEDVHTRQKRLRHLEEVVPSLPNFATVNVSAEKLAEWFNAEIDSIQKRAGEYGVDVDVLLNGLYDACALFLFNPVFRVMPQMSVERRLEDVMTTLDIDEGEEVFSIDGRAGLALLGEEEQQLFLEAAFSWISSEVTCDESDQQNSMRFTVTNIRQFNRKFRSGGFLKVYAESNSVLKISLSAEELNVDDLVTVTLTVALFLCKKFKNVYTG